MKNSNLVEIYGNLFNEFPNSEVKKIFLAKSWLANIIKEKKGKNYVLKKIEREFKQIQLQPND